MRLAEGKVEVVGVAEVGAAGILTSSIFVSDADEAFLVAAVDRGGVDEEIDVLSVDVGGEKYFTEVEAEADEADADACALRRAGGTKRVVMTAAWSEPRTV